MTGPSAILQFPAASLRMRCLTVPVPTVEVDELAARLRESMAARRGRGLAAPQLGETLRVFVLAGYPHAFVNPVLSRQSEETAVEEEGCLSLPPNVRRRIRRSVWVKLSFQVEDGSPRSLKLHGWDARAALHELDHLEGRLITDYEPERSAGPTLRVARPAIRRKLS